MKRWMKVILIGFWMVAASLSAFAQLEKVVAEASGIETWGACGMIMEMSLKRLDGVDKVAISASKQMFAVFYTQGAKFDPKGMRDAVAQASVKVIRFHLQGKGQVVQQGDKLFLKSGVDQFEVVDSPKIPLNQEIGYIGAVDDSVQPYTIKIDNFVLINAKDGSAK